VPILVKDQQSVADQIEKAKLSGRRDWYEAPQAEQAVGPYRHHMRKRKAYLDQVLSRFRKERAGLQLTGLDLGCGDGNYFPWLKSYVDVLYASDYNLLRLSRAESQRIADRVYMADATNYPTRDCVFDLIFFNHVLEHIPDDRGALREVARILKPGGLLVLGIPNEGAAFWQLAYRLEPKVRAASDHVNFYTGASITRMCNDSGLKVSHVEHIGWGVPHWTADFIIRRFKIIDDGLEAVGKRLFYRQATSLFVLCTK
jgi:SAM-dependent methyltransferase